MKLMMCRSTKQICGRSVIVGDINGNCDAWRDYLRPDTQEKENMDREQGTGTSWVARGGFIHCLPHGRTTSAGICHRPAC